MEISIRRICGTELATFKALIRVFEDVFEMQDFRMPPDAHLQNLLSNPEFYVFVAEKENEVVAGLTAYTLHQYYALRPLVYIFDLAVQTNLQRQGIGKKLIAAINDYCREAGVEEVFVQADEVDGYALDFYRATGGIPEKIVHYYYPLNPRETP